MYKRQGIMCSFCSDTIDVYAGQYGEADGTNEPETPEVVGKIVHIESLRNTDSCLLYTSR